MNAEIVQRLERSFVVEDLSIDPESKRFERLVGDLIENSIEKGKQELRREFGIINEAWPYGNEAFLQEIEVLLADFPEALERLREKVKSAKKDKDPTQP